MARPSGRTNSVKGLVGVAIIRLVGRRAETPLRRGQGKSDLPLLLCRLERFRFGAFSLCWHPDLATVRASLAVFGRASCWGLLFEQDQTKNARHSLPFDDVEPLNRKIFRPTWSAWRAASPSMTRFVRPTVLYAHENMLPTESPCGHLGQ